MLGVLITIVKMTSLAHVLAGALFAFGALTVMLGMSSIDPVHLGKRATNSSRSRTTLRARHRPPRHDASRRAPVSGRTDAHDGSRGGIGHLSPLRACAAGTCVRPALHALRFSAARRPPVRPARRARRRGRTALRPGEPVARHARDFARPGRGRHDPRWRRVLLDVRRLGARRHRVHCERARADARSRSSRCRQSPPTGACNGGRSNAPGCTASSSAWAAGRCSTCSSSRCIALVTPGPGALAFGAVVVLTMVASMQFDPRLIWDGAPRRLPAAANPERAPARPFRISERFLSIFLRRDPAVQPLDPVLVWIVPLVCALIGLSRSGPSPRPARRSRSRSPTPMASKPARPRSARTSISARSGPSRSPRLQARDREHSADARCSAVREPRHALLGRSTARRRHGDFSRYTALRCIHRRGSRRSRRSRPTSRSRDAAPSPLTSRAAAICCMATRSARSTSARRCSIGICRSGLSASLDKDGTGVDVQAFVKAPYDKYVGTNTRWWHASGVDLRLDSSGLKLNTQSLATVIVGGLAFSRRPASRRRRRQPTTRRSGSHPTKPTRCATPTARR